MVNKCQYNKPNCSNQAQYQHIIKLGAVKLDKGYICQNCKEFMEKTRKEPKT